MKTTPPDTTADALTQRMIASAKGHVASAETHLRKGCAAALQAGLCLIWLHKHTAADKNENLRRGPDVSRETSGISFESALAQIGIKRPTAYRWMNAATAAAVQATLIFSAEDILEQLPDPEEEKTRWGLWLNALAGVAMEMSLRRLLLGGGDPNSDDARQETLISRAESGDPHAEEALAKIAAGQLTLVQAMRAAAGALATKEKTRNDPVYLSIDPADGSCGGLFFKAAVTLKNAFSQWSGLPQPARDKAKETWLELVSALPPEFTKR